jgi:chromosome segregation ATPase
VRGARGADSPAQRLVEDRVGEDQLQKELDDMQAQLELYVANNPGVIEQYDARKRAVRTFCLSGAVRR